MNLVELDHALRKLRLSGMAATLETRLLEAQSERHAPIDLVSTLVYPIVGLRLRGDRPVEAAAPLEVPSLAGGPP